MEPSVITISVTRMGDIVFEAAKYDEQLWVLIHLV